MDEIAYCVSLNPEPWAMGDINRRKGRTDVSPNRTMKAYKDALAAELLALGAKPRTNLCELDFLFSRELVSYATARGTKTRNEADVTNMQKATEDALQGVLIENDRRVIDIHSRLAWPQSGNVQPWVLITVRYGAIYYGIDRLSYVQEGAYQAMLDRAEASKTITDNTYTP